MHTHFIFIKPCSVFALFCISATFIKLFKQTLMLYIIHKNFISFIYVHYFQHAEKRNREKLFMVPSLKTTYCLETARKWFRIRKATWCVLLSVTLL